MSKIMEFKDAVPEQEVFNVRLVKCSPPIIIKDGSKIEDNSKAEGDNIGLSGYPPEYEDIFNCIFPPEEWEEDGKTWRRLASLKPATREDVLTLNRDLMFHMSYWQASSQGLCRIRRELYSQCFNELIRQVALINLDRAELLVRIRDDARSTIEAYKQISEDCQMYNTRKEITGVNVTETLENNYQSLKDRNNLLKKETTEAQRRYAIIKHNLIEEFNALKISNQHEIEFYTINTEALQAQANMILNTKK